MSKPSSKPPVAKPPRDYNRALDALQQLEGTLISDESPLVKDLKVYLGPLEEQVKAGKLSKQQFMMLGGQFAQDWVSKHMFDGQGLPSDDEIRGPILQAEIARRERLMQPSGSAAVGAVPEVNAPTEQNPYGPLDRQAKALAVLRAMVPQQPPTQPTAPKPVAAQRLGGGVRVPTTATTDEGRLGESQLLMLQNLFKPVGYNPAGAARHLDPER